MTHNLYSLLNQSRIECPQSFNNIPIHNICADSRCVGQGELFFGLSGSNVDGGCFWRKAIAAGAAAAVIGPVAANFDPPSEKDLVFVVSDPVAYWMGKVAAVFWGEPSLKMDLIGVTGTNGKTTTTYLIEYLSSTCGTESALFGTLFNRWPNHSEVSTHTTSFGDKLQKQLAEASSSGALLGAMEVSSHALAQRRVAGCHFSGAVFTNLTHDHLDYHATLEDYFEAKAQLFESPYLKDGLGRAVINIDNPWGYRLSERLKERCWRASLDMKLIESKKPELFVTDLNMSVDGIKGVLHSPSGVRAFHSSLIGKFNLMNCLEAVGILLQRGFSLEKLLLSMETFPGVPGRMEKIKVADDQPLVVVDYAHTPDGLEKALSTLRYFVSGKVWCVFGCGGDRDRGKRSTMGAIASELADVVVITSDNPRNENPEQIIADIISGISNKTSMLIESDRSNAIRKAVSESLAGDIVLIAGKGHEDYQLIGTQKITFDDRDVAKKALFMRKQN